MPDPNPPSLQAIQETRAALGDYLNATPTHRWQSAELRARLGDRAAVYLKLELFQRTGTFKARAALNNVRAIDPRDRSRGITAMSAGNHAIAAAYAAACFGMHAKLVMQASANPARVAAARALGAEILIAADGPRGFALTEQIANEERRSFIHPFDGVRVAEATAGVGLELLQDAGDLDALICPIGGGGLCGGIATVTKLLQPRCRVFGVEPEGAAVMLKSFAAGSPQHLSQLDTIADSLAPPFTTDCPFSLCRRFVDELVCVSDDQMAASVALLFKDMKLAVEPAAAAATAALLGPLRERMAGKRVGVIVCGSNIDAAGFQSLLTRGEQALADGIFAI